MLVAPAQARIGTKFRPQPRQRPVLPLPKQSAQRYMATATPQGMVPVHGLHFGQDMAPVSSIFMVAHMGLFRKNHEHRGTYQVPKIRVFWGGLPRVLELKA